jgi:hypothetical protein
LLFAGPHSWCGETILAVGRTCLMRITCKCSTLHRTSEAQRVGYTHGGFKRGSGMRGLPTIRAVAAPSIGPRPLRL